jgi:predicted membrane protein
MSATRHLSRNQHNGPRILFGIAVVGFGVLALLDNLRSFDLSLLKTFWPLALTVAGVGRVLSGRHFGHRLFGIALALFGLLLTADHLDLLQFSPRDWWPVVIIGVGLSMLMRGQPTQARAATVQPGASIDIDASFGSIDQQHASRSFKGGRIDASFASVALDLRQAVMDGPEAVLDISARFSGIALCVPRDWQVVVDIAPTLGGVENHTVPPLNPTQRLVLRGDATFSGIEIRH